MCAMMPSWPIEMPNRHASRLVEGPFKSFGSHAPLQTMVPISHCLVAAGGKRERPGKRKRQTSKNQLGAFPNFGSCPEHQQVFFRET